MNSPVILSFYSQLMNLLPSFCQTIEKSKENDFTRNRKLPLPRLLVTLLHLTAGGSRHDGVDIKLGDFFNLSRRDGLWPEVQTPHRSALTKARSKLGWEAFAGLLRKAVDLERIKYFRNATNIRGAACRSLLSTVPSTRYRQHLNSARHSTLIADWISRVKAIIRKP